MKNDSVIKAHSMSFDLPDNPDTRKVVAAILTSAVLGVGGDIDKVINVYSKILSPGQPQNELTEWEKRKFS